MSAILSVGLALLFGGPSDEVVLRDISHQASLIYERKKDKETIVETETWSEPQSSRIIKSTYTDKGQLIERTVAITKGFSTSRADAEITPHIAEVRMTTQSGGTGRVSKIPLTGRLTVTDPSVLWFNGEKPDTGMTATFMSFDPEFRYWEEITVLFQGRGKLDNSQEGNLVTRQTARETIKLLLDDKGMPLIWDTGRLRLYRTSP